MTPEQIAGMRRLHEYLLKQTDEAARAVCRCDVCKGAVVTERWRVYEWFSFSHWGMFRLPIFIAPGWYVDGLGYSVDAEDIEFCGVFK